MNPSDLGHTPCLVARAVEAMLAGRRDRRPIPLLTETFGPIALEQAYEIQEALAERLSVQLGPVCGRKVAFATPDGLRKYRLSEPVSGPLFASQMIDHGGAIHASEFLLFHIEAEVAFVVGETIDQECTARAQLGSFIRSIHASLEIADCCYDLSRGEQTIADFVANGGGAAHAVLGPAVAPSSIDVDRLQVTMNLEARRIYEGSATAVLGSPWNVMLWIARQRRLCGRPLRPGDIVLTGKLAPAWKARGADAEGRYAADFGPLGSVSCRVER